MGQNDKEELILMTEVLHHYQKPQRTAPTSGPSSSNWADSASMACRYLLVASRDFRSLFMDIGPRPRDIQNPFQSPFAQKRPVAVILDNSGPPGPPGPPGSRHARPQTQKGCHANKHCFPNHTPLGKECVILCSRFTVHNVVPQPKVF